MQQCRSSSPPRRGTVGEGQRPGIAFAELDFRVLRGAISTIATEKSSA